jgi:hypothetical protein
MAQSTRSKLDIANEMLINVNERPRTTLSGAIGDRINSALRQAITDINTLNDWSWLRETNTANKWVNEEAQLPVFQRILAVKWREQKNRRRHPLKFLSHDVFDEQPKTAYNSSQPQRPRFYTVLGDYKIAVTPYPTDTTEQARVEFDFITFVDVPDKESGKFSIPEEYLDLLLHRATAVFALTHLSDYQLAGTFNQGYESLAQRMRDKDRGIPAGGINLFRPVHGNK